MPTPTRIEDLLAALSAAKSADLFHRVRSICQKQLDVLHILEEASRALDDGEGGQRHSLIASHYRIKLQNLRVSMFKINERCIRLQSRLNSLRKDLPPQHALVEAGPFYFRCIYRGGVRFRDYPSSTAKMTGNIIAFDEIAQVFERVFISGESSVYLHVQGVGWLFENRDSLRCMERCSAPVTAQEDEDSDSELLRLNSDDSQQSTHSESQHMNGAA